MKDIVSIRKMHPAPPWTNLGFGAEEGVSGAAAIAPVATAVDEDLLRGDNNLV
jgi:hypothetical protein